MLFEIFTTLLISSTILAAAKPKPRSFNVYNGESIYPNYYVQHASPFSDFQNSFVQAAFLPGSNFVDQHLKQTNANDKTYDAKTFAAFEAAFGDKDSGKSAASVKAKIYSADNVDNVNVVNPFLAAKDAHGKLLKAANGLSGVKAAKPGLTNAKTFSFVNPLHGNGFDPIFGPEIAPRYEIQYSPQGYSFDSVNPDAASSWNDFHFGFQPNFNTAFDPHSSWYPSSFPSSYPNHYPAPFPAPFPTNFPSYPFPNPFVPGFDPKGLKPKGTNNGGKAEPTTENALETTSENFQETTSEATTESSTSESSSESSSESTSQASS